MVDLVPVIADMSIFIGSEGRRFPEGSLDPYLITVSVVTLGELRLGVLSADGPTAMSRRLETFQLAETFDAMPIDDRVADAWSELVAAIRQSGRRRMPLNDSWIAATAKAHRIPVLTQDADFDGVPGLNVVRI